MRFRVVEDKPRFAETLKRSLERADFAVEFTHLCGNTRG
jgi:ActR/RegA family two-component response regulator